MAKPLLMFCLLHCSLAYRHVSSLASSLDGSVDRTNSHDPNASAERADSERTGLTMQTDSSMLEQRHQEGNLSSLASAVCDGDGMGHFTVGLLYNRKETVNNTIAAMTHFKKEGWFVQTVGKLARSKALGKMFGGAYRAVNKKIIADATPLIIAGLAEAWITLASTRQAQIQPGEGDCPEKTGMVLLEFKVCGISHDKNFDCCNVFGKAPTTRLGGWARDFALVAWDWFKWGAQGVVGGQILSGLVSTMPGQLMFNLHEAGLGNPNVKLWPRQIDDTMFADLASSPTTELMAPLPACPPAPGGGDC